MLNHAACQGGLPINLHHFCREEACKLKLLLSVQPSTHFPHALFGPAFSCTGHLMEENLEDLELDTEMGTALIQDYFSGVT